ncbi:hypothetical protein Cfor_10063 [Coptotermes formosanus]|uniref:Caspase family p20 domain-containing protein n=1 Tax=Coptotermes formosanus TaxID=36987 RepID=A0A6L2PJU6_COPFO|nr:hypothetical protein Cfor_10063 [Coptotermes formosanus]
MESPSSETGDNMPTQATDSIPVTHGGRQDATEQSLVHGDSVKQYTAPIEAGAGEYNMNHEKRGRAIIFNHEKYIDELGLPERTGTNIDKICLKQRFEKLKFDVDVFDDLIFSDIKKKLTEIAKADHKNEDCLVIAVLTHGEGKSNLYAHDCAYKTDTLWSSFTADVCPELAGKPKIFIIQACRGSKVSESMNFKSSIQIDSHKMDSDGIIHRYSIPVEADQLVAFSTYEGRVALRETGDGTWFIQEFCKELEDNGEMADLLTLFTNVSRRVAVSKVYFDKKHQQVKQMPVVQSTLTRKLFFSSVTIRSRITITPDVNSLLEKTNEKLDNITKMLEDKKTSLPVSKVKPARKQSFSLSWENLQSSKQPMTNPMPQGEAVYKLAAALKMFLEDEAHKLEPTEKENGEFILNFLSCWENMNEDLKWYGYKKLVVFLKEHAKNWKVFKLLDIADYSPVSVQQCHRRGSQADVVDSVTPVTRSVAIPRRTPTARRPNTLSYQ